MESSDVIKQHVPEVDPEVDYFGSKDSNGNLQTAFSKFRTRKINEIKLAKFNKGEPLNRSQEYKDSLRKSFIESCMGYLGVPYSKRYKDEGADDAPLYLDCCGLVRRAVQDNQEQFGFVIGRWNQAYQIDTLPIIPDEKDLIPGDLIFYEGKYINPKHKAQKHDIVHVEVYLGGGSTMGARLKRGVISVFPSYKFESTAWTLIKYHYRSLNTWLDGQCVSHCAEHSWIDDAPIVGVGALKSSIFYDESLEESAGDISDEDEETPEAGNQQCTFSNLSLIKLSSADAGLPDVSTLKLAKGLKSKSYMNRKSALTYYVNKSNGWKLVKDALDKRGWQQMPFESKLNTRYDLKWVERKSDIDYRSHNDGQLANHFPNNECITTKVSLLKTMRECFSKVAANGIERTAVPWLPETFDLDSPADCQAAIQVEDDCMIKTGKGALWIFKPASNNRGRGIRLIQGRQKLEELCQMVPEEKSSMTRVGQKGIVQRYIEDPLLAISNGEKYKFDVRCYLLIATSTPAFVCFYHPGYCRFTLKAYSTDEASLEDAAIHLTNAAIQKKDPSYADKKELQVCHLFFHYTGSACLY
jgi:cell wall-associated NlpC family hydrolase